MKLSKNFTLEELTKTSTGLANIPPKWVEDNLKRLCVNVLQPIRDLYGFPIYVNSGYRSREVNKAVNGVSSSQHIYGYAADITAGSREENRRLFNLILLFAGKIPFDQLIDENNYQWLHISHSSYNRKQVLHL
ncbi:MAG: hypothetical protein HUJ63_02930 [Enterococcus sp.]|nr:hypothetical protein [Enterococcus sp.]